MDSNASVQPLTFRTRLAYGIGAVGPAMAGSTMIFYLMLFFTDVAGLNAALAGSVLMVGKIWDAINDPLVGLLSDKTRTRYGRRLPWMALGAIPFALFFAMDWWVPPFLHSAANQTSLFLYFVIVSIFMNLAYTAVSLPHQALIAELSTDYDERTRLAGFRQGAELAGSVGGLILAILIFAALKNHDKQTQYLVFGSTIGGVALVGLILCLIGIWKPVCEREKLRIEQQTAEKSLGFIEQFQIALRNGPFMMVCGIYLFSWLAMQFTATILPYYVTHCLGLSSTIFQTLALTVQVTALLLIPLWSWACVKLGKKTVYQLGMVCWIAAQSFLFFLPKTDVIWLYLLGFIAGFGVSVCYLVPTAMLPDVIELDELQTGKRREGLFYGFLVLLQKFALAIGTFVVMWAIGLAGYLSHGPGEATPVQPESALFAIRIAIGPLPTLSLLLGMFLTWKYPITKERHAEILRQLAERKAKAAA